MNKTLVVDIDDTLTFKHGKDYTIDSLPNLFMIKRINKLHQLGWKIVLFTARKMESSGHDAGKALARGGYNTFKWLEKHKVEFDAIHFGKPNGIIIDDKAIGYDMGKVFLYLDNLINEGEV